MVIQFFNRAFWLSTFIILQVLVFNYINIAGYATPLLYIFFILKLDSYTSRNSLLMWGFFLGLIMDVFCDTLGMNTAITVLVAFIRPYFLNFFKSNDIEGNITPSFKSMGVVPFMKYTFYLIFLHHTLFYAVEYFSFSFFEIVFSAVCSVLSSLFFIACIEFMRR